MMLGRMRIPRLPDQVRPWQGLALLPAIWLLGVPLPAPAAAIVLNQVDDFQSGTLQYWTGGSAPTNQPNGGPGGAGDRFLRITSGGGPGNLGVFNAMQWAGSYQAAAVGRVSFDLNNFGPDPVSLRVMILTAGCEAGATGCTAWTSTNATVLPAASGWVIAEFSLAESDLTLVRGSLSYGATMSSVERLLLRHDAGTPHPPGIASYVNAVVGIDNVTALPEPPGIPSLLASLLLLWSGRQPTRRPPRKHARIGLLSGVPWGRRRKARKAVSSRVVIRFRQGLRVDGPDSPKI